MFNIVLINTMMITCQQKLWLIFLSFGLAFFFFVLAVNEHPIKKKVIIEKRRKKKFYRTFFRSLTLFGCVNRVEPPRGFLSIFFIRFGTSCHVKWINSFSNWLNSIRSKNLYIQMANGDNYYLKFDFLFDMWIFALYMFYCFSEEHHFNRISSHKICIQFEISYWLQDLLREKKNPIDCLRFISTNEKKVNRRINFKYLYLVRKGKGIVDYM